MGFGRKDLGGGEEIKKNMNAMWRNQGITDGPPAIYLNTLIAMPIHYFEACFVRSLLLKWFWCPMRAPGVCGGSCYIHIFHSEEFPTLSDLA